MFLVSIVASYLFILRVMSEAKFLNCVLRFFPYSRLAKCHGECEQGTALPVLFMIQREIHEHIT